MTVLTHATPVRTATARTAPARPLRSAHPAAPPVLPTPVDRGFEELLASLPLTRSVVVDLPGRRLVVDGAPVDLTRQEFDLVAYLARSAGRVVTRDELFAAAWRSQDLSAATRTIDVHVRRVRAKSGLDGLIATVRGVGYRLNALDGLRVEG
ncbi:winged helix-turn-helix domain-containing protein [Cellulomonas endometrii]|uniref:winged helix-turn-helix domain-containing protein n=1 Tax=Cellulomonas endometrii TaxID=3036301 RepID=UPI0024AC9750|nr:winged helix-turn-helix domain-containing protein [Cellulomonas endometrii]